MDDRSIFLDALDKGGPEDRTTFLDEACGDDAELRRRVEILLAAHEDAGSFLDKRPEELAATASTEEGLSDWSGDAWHDLLQASATPDCIGVIGPYEVVELIGRGGMGIVVRAHDPKLKRTVAIKLLAPELAANRTSVRRFLREAQAAAAVSHDHVVTIHAIDEDAMPPRIVMEYVDGQSLQQRIDQSGALDLKSVLRIGMQTAAGLAAAHRQGLVHRDVKPSNILLENGIGRVKLSDFGLARAIDDIAVTRTGEISGTPQYMSPEQAQAHRVDHRTDLFSLGCVLYAMCTGHSAFRADSAVAVMHSVIHDTPKPIRAVNPEIPEWLCEIVNKLLEKDACDRFESAAEVEDLLARHLAHLQQPDSVQQPERVGPSRSVRDTKSSRELSELLQNVSRARHQATMLLATVGVLDVVLCLALFFGIAPMYRGSDIPNVLAISTILGGLIGIVLLVLTLTNRRFLLDGELPRPMGLVGGILALLPFGGVHILVIPVSIWIIYVFWRSPNFETNDASTRPTKFRKHWGTKWPALYVGLIALMLASLALEADSGVISRTWFNFTGQGRITLKVRDAEVRVTLNGAPRAVSENGQVHVVVAAGVYVIRSSRAIYVHEIQPGFRITQKIHHGAAEVAIIGPVSTDKLDQGARIELLEKYSQ